MPTEDRALDVGVERSALVGTEIDWCVNADADHATVFDELADHLDLLS